MEVGAKVTNIKVLGTRKKYIQVRLRYYWLCQQVQEEAQICEKSALETDKPGLEAPNHTSQQDTTSASVSPPVKWG